MHELRNVCLRACRYCPRSSIVLPISSMRMWVDERQRCLEQCAGHQRLSRHSVSSTVVFTPDYPIPANMSFFVNMLALININISLNYVKNIIALSSKYTYFLALESK